MPEKAHTKFDDGEPKPVAPSAGNSNDDMRKSSKQGSRKANQTNGVKRFRDGSPKATASLKPTEKCQDQNTANLKKQRTNSQSRVNPLHNSQPRTAVNGTASTSKNINGSEQQKPQFTNSATFGGQKLKSNGNFTPQRSGGSQQALLRKVKEELEKVRKALPIWSKKADIRWALRNNDILLLNGETGSGKSTQTPQFLCTEPWCRKQTVKITTKDGRREDLSVGGIIAITEPRRVAAITLAQRVAREMGYSLGKEKRDGPVGYSVRFDSIIPPGMKIKFVTEGMLLQEMLRDPNLRQYSAIIVDEIHERSVDVDLIAGFLRQLIHGDKTGRGGIPLKVVIMSATMDLGGLETFFAKPETLPSYQPGKNYGQDFFGIYDDLEDNADDLKGVVGPYVPGDPSRRSSTDSTRSFSSWEGISSSGESNNAERPTKPATNGIGTNSADATTPENAEFKSSLLDEAIAENGVVVEYVEGRQYPVEVWYENNPSPDYLRNMLQTILKLHTTEPLPGDILAFLTGQEEIETLQTQLEHYAGMLAKGVPRLKIMPLYGSLSAQAQQDAFEKVKEPRTRKVVLATNIAETSVTVSGVRFVVDCGKSKVKQYRPRLGMESLLAKPISKTSAIQRQGRAGREAPGKCYRIYTATDFQNLEADELPEILRSDVIEAVLKMKARGVDDVLSFPLMDSPDIVAMEKALVQLHSMGALDDQGNLTENGKNMAGYPLPAAYGRVVIAAAESDCLLEAIDVIACLTADAEVFIQAKSEEDQEKIVEHRKDLQHRSGDIITYLTTMQKYAAETTDRNEWCRKRLISVRAMKMALAVRKQLRQVCYKQKLLSELPPPDPQAADIISEERAEVLIKTFLEAFATKTAVLGPDGAYYTTVGRNVIAIHPSSILFGKKVEAIMFLDHVFTAKSYAKKVTAIQANWIMGALDL
jgi:ATP-dependent RNA helicase DHR2